MPQPQTLSRRALNRATLQRQLLLRRANLPVTDAVEHLIGLQAQTPHSWYVGLWTRIAGFRPDHATDLLTRRHLVRIALMRSTIHLVTAADCLALRPVMQPALDRDLYANHTHGRAIKGMHTGELVAAGRTLLDEQPRTPGELGALLQQRWPDRKPQSLAYAIRNLAPLVQVPPRGVWGASGQTRHATAESWLGRRLNPVPSAEPMILRYLASFGPANVKDIQTWSGLTRLGQVVDNLRPLLITFRDEQGRELFDLPDAPRPDPDTPAPPRFLYDFDNLLLSHGDRSRVVTDQYRQQNPVPDGTMPRIVLIDGFTAATWTMRTHRGRATLTIHPFNTLSKKDIEALTSEGAALLAFAAAGASAHDIHVELPS